MYIAYARTDLCTHSRVYNALQRVTYTMAIGFCRTFVYFLIILCVILLKLDFFECEPHVVLFGCSRDEHLRGNGAYADTAAWADFSTISCGNILAKHTYNDLISNLIGFDFR